MLTSMDAYAQYAGREERTGDRLGLGREGERLGKLRLELDGRQPAESVLRPLPVILPLDLDDDRETKFLPGHPSPLIQDVRLNEGPEALHSGVVAGCADAAHRSDHVVSA